jgi:hypothetical protein
MFSKPSLLKAGCYCVLVSGVIFLYSRNFVVAQDDDQNQPKAKPYASYKYVEVDIESYEDIKVMEDTGATLVSEYPHFGRNLYVVAPRSMASLEASGLSYKVIHENFQEIVDAERARIRANRVDPKAPAYMTVEGSVYSDWYLDYKLYDDIISRMQYEWTYDYPDLVQVGVLGNVTYEGRQISIARIGYSPSGKPKV